MEKILINGRNPNFLFNRIFYFVGIMKFLDIFSGAANLKF